MTGAMVVITMFVGALGGIWALVATRASARKPAGWVDDRVRLCRAGVIWWSVGLLLGVLFPLMFVGLYLNLPVTEQARPPDTLVVAGIFALGGSGFLAFAAVYRVFFDAEIVERRSLFRPRRSLRWADVTSVTWLPITERLFLRGDEVDSEIRIGAAVSGFLDFVAAVEEHVRPERRGDAVERARRNVGAETPRAA